MRTTQNGDGQVSPPRHRKQARQHWRILMCQPPLPAALPVSAFVLPALRPLDLARMMTAMKRLIVIAALCSACGGGSSVSPSPTPAPAAAPVVVQIPPAFIVLSSSANWTSCLPAIGGFIGSCMLDGSIQNTGSGCAAGLTATIQLKDASGQQLGSDRLAVFLMPSGHVIRPAESIQFQTLSVDLPTVNATKTFGIKPTWSNVSCS